MDNPAIERHGKEKKRKHSHQNHLAVGIACCLLLLDKGNPRLVCSFRGEVEVGLQIIGANLLFKSNHQRNRGKEEPTGTEFILIKEKETRRKRGGLFQCNQLDIQSAANRTTATYDHHANERTTGHVEDTLISTFSGSHPQRTFFSSN